LLEEETNTELPATSTSSLYTLELLHPFYTYRISVAAVTVLPGPYSEEITVQTLEAGNGGYTDLVTIRTATFKRTLNVQYIHKVEPK